MIYLQDPDVTLYHGDVLETLRELPAESVDCVVTSPPYWGLRDYGTGAWEGGDAECDHLPPMGDAAGLQSSTLEGGKKTTAHQQTGFGQECGKCGATRIDQQLGLEPTPEQYVERMVEVFREVRRVLAAHGTVWLNLGDSYSADHAQKRSGGQRGLHARIDGAESAREGRPTPNGLKPKDLVGIPWRVAFALQADGWYLRSDIIWAKPNPMPESVTDRPTKAHEYVFMLSKQPRYFFDQEAVREPHTRDWTNNGGSMYHPEKFPKGSAQHRGGKEPPVLNPAGRNIRSVWEIATQPYPEAHFATFPEELARRCIAAGCPEQVCRVCGKARERVVEVSPMEIDRSERTHALGHTRSSGTVTKPREATTTGWTDCTHADYRPGIVLDPFMGSGTVAHVARKLGRHAVGIDLSAEYLALAAKRLQQQSLFALSE